MIRLSRTKANIASNLVGRATAAVLGILFVPVYLRYLGVEQYGIIGFFTTIQALLLLLDGGISPTLNREVARLSLSTEQAPELRDMVRTLEIPCWITAAFTCAIALVLSPIIARYWLTSTTLDPDLVQKALMIMSVTFACQWIGTFYTGGLQGLQEQVLLNAVNVATAILRSVGAFLVLALVSPTLSAFLIWQLLVTLAGSLLLYILFWRKLPRHAESPKFRRTVLMMVWRYAFGMAATSVTVLILTQADKVILSKLLTLKDFGYYVLATAFAGTGIGLIIGSVQTAYYPQLSQLAAEGKEEDLVALYHRACQVMSFFLVPVVTLIAFFSHDILLLWTRQIDIADHAAALLTLIAIGTGLNGLMHIPYYAQLAFGLTKIGFWQNVITILVMVPVMIYATATYGAIGGAMSWALINLSSTVFGLIFMHRFVLKGELGRWYIHDTGIPIVVVSAVILPFWYLDSRAGFSSLTSTAVIACAFGMAAASAVIVLPAIRRTLFGHLRTALAGVRG